jgi:cytochrome c oxidase assembly protein subunit 15
MIRQRLFGWIPTEVTRPVRVAGWINLAFNVGIVVTGGAVRLTASGLGCPTWPMCTEESLVNTPEMGIHGVIEFANRVLTFALVLAALATFILVIRMRRRRPALFWLAFFVGVGIPVQALIGGISVLVMLNPYVVGLHFVVSAIIIALCSVFVCMLYPRTAEGPAPAYLRLALALVIAFQTITILLGVLVTGSGPHAGDANAPRNNLNSDLLQHLHSIPAYTAVGLTVVAIVLAWFARRGMLVRLLAWLLLANVIQVVVGIIQSRTGLPPLLVGIHMFLACVVVALMTAAATTIRRPTQPSTERGSVPAA